MSEPEKEQLPPDAPDVAEEEDISWEDAMADRERQKQMIKAQQQAQPAELRRPATPAKPTPAKPTSAKPTAPSADANPNNPPNLKFILDIPLQVTVELGRKRLLVHDLLQLSQGSVIELSKQIGEPFEVLVNQKLIARGEVVVINDKFGVRITDIISPLERVQQL
jgi:flagellar motor switch protein FliN/FliY